MFSVRVVSCLLALLVAFVQGSLANSPHIAGPEYEFSLKDNNTKDCFYASFKLNFMISYYGYPNISDKAKVDVLSTQVKLPNKTQVTVSGNCGTSETTLMLSWQQDGSNFESIFDFEIMDTTWYLSQVSFKFTMESFKNPVDTGNQIYVTNPNTTSLFGRDFSNNQYIYCEKCKTLQFKDCSDEAVGACISPCPIKIGADKNVTQCSDIEIMQSIMFPGDFETQSPDRKLCLEDYIALQELIVPIIVGGLLGVLLVLIFVAYIIAYIRRRRKEGQYERVGEGSSYN